MKKERGDDGLSRRQALALAAGTVGAAWLGPATLWPYGADAGEATTKVLAPPDGLLKKRGVTGRTVNVHTHVLGEPSGGAIPPPSMAPFASGGEISDADRENVRTTLARFKGEAATYDSPEQEEEVQRRRVLNANRGRTGTLEENAAHLIAEMDEAGIDTSVVLYLDFAAPMLKSGPVDPSTELAEKGLEAAAKVSQRFPGRFIRCSPGCTPRPAGSVSSSTRWSHATWGSPFGSWSCSSRPMRSATWAARR
jgi:hypothetical protein